MAKNKNKKNLAVQRVVIVGSVLIALQIVYLYVFNKNEVQTFKDSINKQISTIDGTEREKTKKLLLGYIYDFRANNNEKWPTSLTELAPKYFDRIPIDPETGQPFKFWIENSVPYIGDKSAASSAAKASTTEEEALIASLSETAKQTPFIYDPSGKRDPFRPFNLAPKSSDDGNRTPLEKYQIGQLKLTAVLGSGDGGSAMVENAAGRGFTIKKGTKIGTNGGEVIDIHPDKILILEQVTDFTGQTSTKTIEMRLRIKGADDVEPPQ